MTTLKAQGLEAFLRKPDPAVGLLLIHGDDGDAVRELAAKAVKKIAGSLDDPFAVVRLDDGDLAGDPARLADEMQSISMFGGRKAIWVKDAGDGFLKAAGPVIDGRSSGNFIVAEAHNLGKTSALRQAVEKSAHAAILPVYEAEDGDIALLVEQILGKQGLAIEPDAKFRFLELAGTQRGLVMQEIEKLGLYCLGQKTVTLEDVEAVCGGGAEYDGDELADAVFTGAMDATDRIAQAMLASGTDSGRLVSLVHQHALKLQDMKLAIEKGASADAAMMRVRPPVFFKRKGTVQTQLSTWPMEELLKAAATLGEAIEQARLNPAIAESLASRALLSIARNGRALAANRF